MLYEGNGNGIQKEGWGRDELMAEGTFKVEVPITIKGGREGDKVGKQIGDKIANALNKSLKSVGFGGTKSSASPNTGSGGGLMGMSKGLSKVAGKLTVVGAVGVAILEILKKSSARLSGVLSIFGRAFLMFFRPFGDFLATLLRPMAILMMKMAVSWLKFTKTKGGKAAVGGLMGAAAGAAAGSVIPGVGTFVGAIVGGVIGIINALFPGFLTKMATFSLAGWMLDKIKSIWTSDIDWTSWLWSKIQSMWTGVIDFTAWIWDKIISIWKGTIDLSGWIWDKITGMWSGTWNALDWFKNKVKSLWGGGSSNSGDDMHGDGSSYYTPVQNDQGQSTAFPENNSFLDLINKPWQGFATGSRFVPKTGLAMLHRGESVVPRVQNNNSSNQSVVLQPTINIMGNSSDIDADEIARQFSSMTMMELKSRGIA